jgi:hypothetical protein
MVLRHVGTDLAALARMIEIEAGILRAVAQRLPLLETDQVALALGEARTALNLLKLAVYSAVAGEGMH